MADLAPTGTTLGSQSTRKLDVQFGETVAENDMVYQKASDGKSWKADANASLEAATSKGICLVGGAVDAWGIIATSGPVILAGVTMAIGDAYYLSRTAGKIMPQADLQAGDYVSYLGNATTALILDLSIKNYGTLLV